MKKIAHLTTVHKRFDTRIFIKMCSSIAKYDYDISLVVADGKRDQVKNGVSIINVGPKNENRLLRMTKTVNRAFEKAMDLDADIYHLHDPELTMAGLKLKKLGKKVIFDAHEDLPKQIIVKPYLNKTTRIFLSKIFSFYEKWIYPKFDAIVAATPFIREKFLKINPNTLDINNYPLLHEFDYNNNWLRRENEVTYVGGITKIRGIENIVSALDHTNSVCLNLAGTFGDTAFEEQIKNHESWAMVNELGFLNRQKVNKLLARSKAGIVTYLPAPNHFDAQPNKMFEYMSAGLPIISSNFRLWREIIEDNQCGLCVNPRDPKGIGEAMQYLIDHPLKAQEKGQNGRLAIEKKYNWSIEEKKLIKLYRELF